MKALVFACAIFIAGCASMTAPRGVSDSLVYAQGQVTAMYNTCTELGAQSRIQKRDVELCLAYTDDADAYVELARNLKDPIEKQNALQMALDLLTRLESALKAAKNG